MIDMHIDLKSDYRIFQEILMVYHLTGHFKAIFSEKIYNNIPKSLTINSLSTLCDFAWNVRCEHISMHVIDMNSVLCRLLVNSPEKKQQHQQYQVSANSILNENIIQSNYIMSPIMSLLLFLSWLLLWWSFLSNLWNPVLSLESACFMNMCCAGMHCSELFCQPEKCASEKAAVQCLFKFDAKHVCVSECVCLCWCVCVSFDTLTCTRLSLLRISRPQRATTKWFKCNNKTFYDFLCVVFFFTVVWIRWSLEKL